MNNFGIMKSTPLILLALVTIFFAGCKEEDLEKPTIDSVTINGADHEIEVDAGNAFTFDAQFSDNVGLKEYKIDIHNAFDGHGHNKTLANTPWAFINIFSISGETISVSESIDVPTGIAGGPYHCVVNVLDDVGNEGDFLEVPIIINVADQAAINVTSPDLSVENTIVAGDTVWLSGTVTDDVDIEDIIIRFEVGGHSHKTGGTSFYEETFELTGTSDVSWDFSEMANQGKWIIVPSTAEAGDYTLEIVVVDSDGNYSVAEGIFEL